MQIRKRTHNIFSILFLSFVLFFAGCTQTVATASKKDWLVVLFFFASVIIFILFFNMLKNQNFQQGLQFQGDSSWDYETMVYAVVCFVFILKLILAIFLKGYYPEWSLLAGYVQNIRENGLFTFYVNTNADLLPGYVYILAILSFIAELFGFNAGNNTLVLLMKLPNMIADLLATFLIFRICKKYYNEKVAFLLATLFAFNPVSLFVSAVWGGFDSLAIFFILLTIYFLLNKKMIPMLLALAFALTLKTYALFLLPFIFVYLIRVYRINKVSDNPQNQKVIGKLLYGVILSALVVLLIILPLFAIPMAKGEWNLLLEIVLQTRNVVFSENLFSLYTLLGLNAKQAGLYTWLQWIVLLGIMIVGIFLFVRRKSREQIPLILSIVSLLIVFFLPNKTPAIALLPTTLMFLNLAICNDKRWFVSLAILSVLSYLNIAIVLNGYGYLGLQNTNFLPFDTQSWILYVGSALQIINLCFIIYLFIDISYKNKIIRFQNVQNN